MLFRGLKQHAILIPSLSEQHGEINERIFAKNEL